MQHSLKIYPLNKHVLHVKHGKHERDHDFCSKKNDVEFESSPQAAPQSRQSAKLFLQSSELGLPHPLTRR